MRKALGLFTLLILALLVAPTLFSSQAAITRYVNNTDPTCQGKTPCYATIQAAVNAAQRGDTILIQAGTYREQVTIKGKNSFTGASETDRILIEADPAAPLGSVVLRGASQQCEDGYAIQLQTSKFITLRGLTITGAGGPAISLVGSTNQNQAIHIERNRIFGNGSSACNGGITIGKGNPDTLVVNNLIYGNGQNGITFKSDTGSGGTSGPHHVINNTIRANGGNGVVIVQSHEVLLVNNLITQNGTAGSTEDGFGVKRQGDPKLSPQPIQLLDNMLCGNRVGEIKGPVLDSTDTGNLTPTGKEGSGVSASPGCEVPGNVYKNVNGPDGLANTADDDFTLAPASPAIDKGADPRTLGLGTPNAIFEADFSHEGVRPKDGDSSGTPQFDLGALEFNRPPVANAGPAQTVTLGATVHLDGSGSKDPDGDTLRFRWTLTTRPAGSQATLSNASTATPSFVADVLGTYVVQLIVNDGLVDSTPATVSITAKNRPPVAVADSATTTAGTAVTIAVLANDSDPDGDPLTVISFTQGAHGTVTFANNVATYTPNASFTGTDTFTYTISDGKGGTDTATVTVTVKPPLCSPPTITSVGPASGPVGTEVTITGTNLDCGTTRSLSLNGVPAVITSLSPTVIKTFIPLGGQDGPFCLTTAGGTACSPTFDVTLSRDFSLAAAPADSTVIQGSSTTYKVSASGTDGFSDLIALGVTGLPSGVSGSFSPGSITAGQSATLMIKAADTAALTSAPFSITGAAQIDGSKVTHSASASLTVTKKGQTALVGRVLDTDGLPIKGVAIQVRDKTTSTDDNGNFLLQDPPLGDQVVVVDGGPASTTEVHYPLIPISMTIIAGTTNELPYTPHLHVQKNFNFTPINPTRDTIATDPEMPDVALRIPAGTQIIGIDGKPNQKVSIRTVPVGSLPVRPPPPEVRARTVYMFYFGKQGGGTPTRPIPFVAPNDLGLAPGEKARLWYFDESPNSGEAPNDWRIAGTGTVSADGKTIVTDPGVGIPKFCCGAAAWDGGRIQGGQQGGDTPQQGQEAPGGDPVDLSTGILMFTATDMVLPGRIPVVVTRTYRSGDSRPGPFGIGTTMSYDDFLQQTSPEVFTYVYRGNARTQFFLQPDGSYMNASVSAFRGARIMVGTDGTRTLRYKDDTALVFDANGLPIRTRDRNGNEVVIKREVEFNPTEIIEPSGRSLKVTWQILARDRATSVTDPIGRTVRYDYDAQNRLAAVTDPEGGVTQYTYDDQHRMTSITDPRGITFLRNTYDVNSRVCEQEQADKGKFKFYYITADQATLPESTRLQEEAAAGGPISMPPCSAQPSSGTVVATVVVDPMGHPTTRRFNGSGYVTSVTDALGQTTLMEREEGTNLLLSTTDPLERTTRFTYDDFGNVATITDPAGKVRRFEYELTFNRLTKLTDSLGNVTTFEYDAKGNLIAITDPEQNKKPEAERLKTRIAYNEFGQPISNTDPLGHVTRFEYDDVGNLASIIDPLGNTTRRTYDLVSRLIEQTDLRGRTTSFDYDKLNRIKEIADALNGVTKFTYDENGNLLIVTDALNHTTAHTYDNMDRLATRIDPVKVTEFFEYDKVGNLTRHTDRKGQVSTFSYDELNRRIGASYADSMTTSFVYDIVGRLVQATDSVGGTILNDYDVLDRLKAQTTALGTIKYQYNALGRRKQMDVPGQAPITYDYDANSRLMQITQGSQVVDFDYDALGRRKRLTLPNGVATEYSYDDASRLTELIYRNATGVLGNLTYDYDPAGNRTRVGGSFARTLLPDLVASASYDAANRQLIFGNKTMTLPDGKPAYDPNGNLTSITDPTGITTFTWNARNRLIALTAPGITASFTYDPLGRRIAKEINGQLTQYLYDGVDIVQELVNNTPVSYLRSLNIDEPLVRNSTEHRLADALDSTIALTDLVGTVTTAYSYEPFGRTVATGISTNPFQYTGRENDPTELYYYRARYYSPTLHRFLSEDPLRFGGGDMVLYAYVGNNPTNFTDTRG